MKNSYIKALLNQAFTNKYDDVPIKYSKGNYTISFYCTHPFFFGINDFLELYYKAELIAKYIPSKECVETYNNKVYKNRILEFINCLREDYSKNFVLPVEDKK